MEYFAGLDVSMKETHVCVVDGEGEVVLETKATTPA
jgi:transposase